MRNNKYFINQKDKSMPNYKQFTSFQIILILLLALFLNSCATVPILGRKQLLLVSDQEILSLSSQQYDQFLKQSKVDNASANTAMVKRTGRRIAAAVEEFLRDNGLEKEIKNFRWEFNYVRDPLINAFCMPGGKIVVYEGIMRIIANENDLAVVMSHEVAHAVAKHSNERMSQKMLVGMGGAALNIAVSDQSKEVQNLAVAAFGMGTSLALVLPYSRKHEYEADELGLYFMALAGYDPTKADRFWIKMASLGKEKTATILSTHPSDEKRIERIRERVPKVLKYIQTNETKRKKVKLKG